MNLAIVSKSLRSESFCHRQAFVLEFFTLGHENSKRSVSSQVANASFSSSHSGSRFSVISYAALVADLLAS